MWSSQLRVDDEPALTRERLVRERGRNGLRPCTGCGWPMAAGAPEGARLCGADCPGVA